MDTSRSLATIAEISELVPIVGADRIVLAKFVDREWEVIVAKDTVVAGTRGIYFEPDSFLPERPEFEELRKSCFRTSCDYRSGFYVRTIRMRGVYSQGYFQALSTLAQGDAFASLELHADVTEQLGVVQWPNTMDDADGDRNDVRRQFPSYIPKTGLKRIENVKKYYNAAIEEGQKFMMTEKLDGTSCTVFLDSKGEYHVCSRNFDVTGATDLYNQISTYLNLEEKLRAFDRPLIVQGEIIGPKVQNNNYKLTKPEFRVFNIWDLASLARLDLVETATQLGLQTVPILARDFSLPKRMGELREHAEAEPSKLNNGKSIREGLVISTWPLEAGKGEFAFKVISRKYLAKEK